MLVEPEDGESWGPQDINRMTMAEYVKYREHMLNEISLMTPDEVREAQEIRKPVKWFFRPF